MRERHAHRQGISPRLVFGLLLMAAGVLFTADNFGLVDAQQYMRFWPLALVVIGLSKLAAGCWGAGIFWVLAGAAVQASEFGYVELDRLWPLFLVALGARLVSRGMPARHRQPPAEEGANDELVSAFALMSGTQRHTRSRDFRGGDFTAIMGGVEVDLRSAGIASGAAVIDTFVFWGGIEIRVPEDWDVVPQGFVLMGGIDDKTRHPESATQRLVIKGFVCMGGIEIKN